MANRFRVFVDTLKQLLPRDSEVNKAGEPTTERPLTETESRQIDQYRADEDRRWRAIAESGLPIGMLVLGVVLAAFAELIGVWAILGFILIGSAPILLWQQRIERQLIALQEELKRQRAMKR